MATGKRPAFYALPGTKGWQDYLNLLHIPYTLWHLSYVVFGAVISPTVHLDRLLGTLLAFFLAVGIASHSLDELHDRPLGTKIPPVVLVSLAVVSLVGAVALGVVAGILETRWMFAFVAFGGFIVVFYNLGLWHNRFHTDLWFAFSWGGVPGSHLLLGQCLALGRSGRATGVGLLPPDPGPTYAKHSSKDHPAEGS